jgi:SAM-dependent methyltransferase
LLSGALRQIQALRANGFDVTGKTIVEIGSGWVPIAPLIFRMAGAERVITVDLERLMDQSTFQHASNFIAENLEATARRIDFDLSSLNRDNVSDGSQVPLGTALVRSHIDYRAPFNVENLEDGSADVITSRSVLEHIPPKVLYRIFERCRKILRPGGLMIHTIDFTDHFAQYDKSISQLNFLKYEDSAWKWTHWANQFYVNRLRRFEYLDMLRETGFGAKTISTLTNEKAMNDLQTMKICSRYRHVPLDELSVLGSTILADRP